jgi:hypothetical protein
MDLFDIFRRRHRKEGAIPEPGSADFQQAVQGSELPGSTGTVAEGAEWKSVGDATSKDDLAHQLANQVGNAQVEQAAPQTIDLRGSGAREEIVELLKKRGIDPDAGDGQQIDAGSIPGLQEEILEVLKKRGLNLPGS